MDAPARSVFCLFLLPSLAFGADVTVGCAGGTPGTYSSINAALAAIDSQGPNTITISGTCTENVVLSQRERLTLQGAAGGATIVAAAPFMTTIDARNCPALTVRNLTVRGINRSALALSVSTTPTVTTATIETTTGGLALDLVAIVDATMRPAARRAYGPEIEVFVGRGGARMRELPSVDLVTPVGIDRVPYAAARSSEHPVRLALQRVA